MPTTRAAAPTASKELSEIGLNENQSRTVMCLDEALPQMLVHKEPVEPYEHPRSRATATHGVARCSAPGTLL
jgi:hypothetical protein